MFNVDQKRNIFEIVNILNWPLIDDKLLANVEDELSESVTKTSEKQSNSLFEEVLSDLQCEQSNCSLLCHSKLKLKQIPIHLRQSKRKESFQSIRSTYEHRNYSTKETFEFDYCPHPPQKDFHRDRNASSLENSTDSMMNQRNQNKPQRIENPRVLDQQYDDCVDQQ